LETPVSRVSDSSAYDFITNAAIKQATRKTVDLLWTIAVVVLVLWLLGMVSSYTFGGFAHILLVLAIVVVLIRVIQGRRVV
jgi:hypothetical protein